jgi:trans-aconitate methyltransferase
MTASATPRGLLFGTAAESYERFRLGYPDDVVDRTLAYVGHPVGDALEVGAGTGKATRAFASRGIGITALEPDPEMFGVLRRETTGMPVEPVLSTFEDYDGPPVDLVYAAAAMHWTDAATRWDHAADLLREGGALAVFGSPMRIADAEVQDAVASAMRPTLEDDAFRPYSARDREPGWDVGRDLEKSGRFTDVEEHQVAREVVVPKKEYIGYLSTLSAYLQLEPAQRTEVLHRVAEVVPAQVRLDLTVGLHLARRSG